MSPRGSDAEAPAAFILRTWLHDPPLEIGFPARSHYVERCWLPVLGPTATLVLRLLTEVLDCSGDATRVDGQLLTFALGVGGAGGTGSASWRALRRLERFHLARLVGHNELLVRTNLPAVNELDVARLPPILQRIHFRAVSADGEL